MGTGKKIAHQLAAPEKQLGSRGPDQHGHFALGKRAQLARESALKQKVDAQASSTQQHLRLEVSQAHIHRQTAAAQLNVAKAL